MFPQKKPVNHNKKINKIVSALMSGRLPKVMLGRALKLSSEQARSFMEHPGSFVMVNLNAYKPGKVASYREYGARVQGFLAARNVKKKTYFFF